MEPQNKDVESLQVPGAGRRSGSRCLDVFLVTSVLILFVAVSALAAGGYVLVSGREFKAPLRSVEPQAAAMRADPQTSPSSSEAAAFKMQNFVYLEANSSKLDNQTMRWDHVLHGKGTSVGSNFRFNPTDHSLALLRHGYYFAYVEVNLTCTCECGAGHLKLKLGDHLTCVVELPAGRRTVSKKCWTVTQLGGERLITEMEVAPKERTEEWKLELNGSGLGMFLVD